MRSSLIRDLLMPPPYREDFSPAQRRVALGMALIFVTVAIGIDVAIVLGLRGHPRIHDEVLSGFALVNLTVLGALGVVYAIMLRWPGQWRTWLFEATAVPVAFTIAVWIWATGTVTSYFLIAAVVFLMVFRLFVGFRGGALLLGGLLAFHGGAVALELAGVLRPEALFVGEPGRIYDIAEYRILAFASIAMAYVFVFVGGNVVVNKLREKDRALAEVRREAELAADDARHGRLTGTVLGDDFALGELIGRGGMGEIYMGRRISDDSTVAVKVLHGHLCQQGDHLERFRREAQLAERIPQHYTARVLGVGRDAANGLDYIALEYLRGEDLAAYLRRRGPLDPPDLARLAGRIAEALDAAHRVGVVHRDLKPQNIFLVQPSADGDTDVAPEPRLLDFGMSKLMDAVDQTTLTRADAVIGTIAYMAPEQALGKVDEIGPASDRFALAAVLYRALTGRLPFQAGDLLSAIREITSVHPPPPSSLRPDVPRDVDAVFAIGLAKKAADRYRTAGEMIADLEAAARGRLSPATRERAAALSSLLSQGVESTAPVSAGPRDRAG